MRRSNRVGRSLVRLFARLSPRVTCVLPTGPPAVWTRHCQSTAAVVRVHRLDARADPARLNASGDYAWSGRGQRPVRRVRSPTSAIWLAGFRRRLSRCRARAHLEGHVEGTVDQPRGQATLTADDVEIEGTSIGRVGATIALDGTRAQVHADVPALAARARMDLDIASPYDYNAEARFDRTPIPASIPASLRNQFAISEGVITGNRASSRHAEPSARGRGHGRSRRARADPDGHARHAATIRNPGRLAGSDHRRACRPRRRPDHACADVGNARDDGGGGAASSSSQRSACRSHRDCRSTASTRDARQRRRDAVARPFGRWNAARARTVRHADPARRHGGLRRSAAGNGCGAHRHRRSHAGHAADARRDVADGKTLGPGPCCHCDCCQAQPIRLVRGCRSGSRRFQTSLARPR